MSEAFEKIVEPILRAASVFATPGNGALVPNFPVTRFYKGESHEKYFPGD